MLLLVTMTLELNSPQTLAGDVPQSLKPSPYSCLARPEVDKINTCFDNLKDCHAAVAKAEPSTEWGTVVLVGVGALLGGFLLGSTSR